MGKKVLVLTMSFESEPPYGWEEIAKGLAFEFDHADPARMWRVNTFGRATTQIMVGATDIFAALPDDSQAKLEEQLAEQIYAAVRGEVRGSALSALHDHRHRMRRLETIERELIESRTALQRVVEEGGPAAKQASSILNTLASVLTLLQSTGVL